VNRQLGLRQLFFGLLETQIGKDMLSDPRNELRAMITLLNKKMKNVLAQRREEKNREEKRINILSAGADPRELQFFLLQSDKSSCRVPAQDAN
jgi:hypothetical protein